MRKRTRGEEINGEVCSFYAVKIKQVSVMLGSREKNTSGNACLMEGRAFTKKIIRGTCTRKGTSMMLKENILGQFLW